MQNKFSLFIGLYLWTHRPLLYLANQNDESTHKISGRDLSSCMIMHRVLHCPAIIIEPTTHPKKHGNPISELNNGDH